MAPARITHTDLISTRAVRAHLLRCENFREPTPEIDEPETQIVVTLGGAFVYHVGREQSLVDPNRVAFVNAGETSRDCGAGGADVTCLVLTPAAELVYGPRLAPTALA